MDSDRWQQIKRIYRQALELDKGERRSFVDSTCGGDAELAAEIMQLLEVPTQGSSDIDDIVDAAAASFSTTLPDGERLGPYRILEVIGTGGMGHVYLAERADKEFEQRVAIKTVSWGSVSASSIERFRLERQILANLEHPNIARLLDGGVTEGGLQYLVMEYVDGEPIDSYCDTRRLNIQQRIRLFQKICHAVDYAHRNLVVHRDVKPSNILVTDSGVPKLLDFGIAKIVNASETRRPLTLDSQRMLTPEYASPEQVRGEPVSTATDVYSLGVLLYRLLCGRGPYRVLNELPSGLTQAILQDMPSRPSAALITQENDDSLERTGDEISMQRQSTVTRLRRRLQGDLDNIALKALRKEPERRYAAARDVADDIERYLNQRPVLARGEHWTYTTRKFALRNAQSLAAAAIVLATVITVPTYYAIRLAVERDRAMVAAQEAQEVSGFLSGLFQSASPFVTQGRDMTAHDLLEAGEQRITQLSDQPIVQANLYRVMGTSFTTLGDYERGLALLERSVAILENVDNVDPLLLADGLFELAETQRELQRFDESIANRRRVLELREAALGAEHTDVAYAMARLGSSLGNNGQQVEAIVYLERALDIRKQQQHTVDEETLDIMGVTAVILANLGRYEEALSTNANAIALSEQLIGENHPNTIIRIGNAGIFLHRLYRSDEGLKFLERAVTRGEKIWPADHPQLAFYCRWNARLLQRLGRFDEAETQLESAIKITTAGGHKRSFGFTYYKAGVALWLLQQGDYESASDAYQESVTLASELGGADSPAALFSFIGLGAAKARAKKPVDAERVLRHALEHRDRLHKSEQWPAMRELATTLSAQSQIEEATQIFENLLAEQESIAGTDSPVVLEALISAAAHYRSVGDLRTAEGLAERAHSIAEKALPEGAWIGALATAEYGRTLLAQGERQSALRHFRNARTSLRDTFGPKHGAVVALDAFLQ